MTLNVCNMGKVDIDVFISSAGAALSSHIRPATCAAVAESDGGMQPVYVGLAFTDSKGQWGAARRLTPFPTMGVKELPAATWLAMKARGEKVPPQPNVLTLATRSETVRHGNANVSLPMQLLFQPNVPECRNVSTGGGTATIIEVATICENLGYTLKVEAYPDSREIRLGVPPISGMMNPDRPLSTLRISEKTVVDWAEEEAERKARETPQPVNWSDLLATLRRGYGRQRDRDLFPKYIVIRGTVSKVEVNNVFFRESPDIDRGPNFPPAPEFAVCTTRLDIFQDVFGADFRTSMIGKSIEVQGEPFYGTGACGIGITLARQVRPVPSAQFAVGTRFWVPPPSAVPSFTPAETAALQAKWEEDLQRRHVCAEQAAKAYPEYFLKSEQRAAYQKLFQACMEGAGSPTSAPSPTPAAAPVAAAPATAPAKATAPAAPTTTESPEAAAARAKAVQDQQQRAAQDRLATQQKSAQDARQRAQKSQACILEWLKAHPDGGQSDPVTFQMGYAACLQMGQAQPAK